MQLGFGWPHNYRKITCRCLPAEWQTGRQTSMCSPRRTNSTWVTLRGAGVEHSTHVFPLSSRKTEPWLLLSFHFGATHPDDMNYCQSEVSGSPKGLQMRSHRSLHTELLLSSLTTPIAPPKLQVNWLFWDHYIFWGRGCRYNCEWGLFMKTSNWEKAKRCRKTEWARREWTLVTEGRGEEEG